MLAAAASASEAQPQAAVGALLGECCAERSVRDPFLGAVDLALVMTVDSNGLIYVIGARVFPLSWSNIFSYSFRRPIRPLRRPPPSPRETKISSWPSRRETKLLGRVIYALTGFRLGRLHPC